MVQQTVRSCLPSSVSSYDISLSFNMPSEGVSTDTLHLSGRDSVHNILIQLQDSAGFAWCFFTTRWNGIGRHCATVAGRQDSTHSRADRELCCTSHHDFLFLWNSNVFRDWRHVCGRGCGDALFTENLSSFTCHLKERQTYNKYESSRPRAGFADCGREFRVSVVFEYSGCDRWESDRCAFWVVHELDATFESCEYMNYRLQEFANLQRQHTYSVVTDSTRTDCILKFYDDRASSSIIALPTAVNCTVVCTILVLRRSYDEYCADWLTVSNCWLFVISYVCGFLSVT